MGHGSDHCREHDLPPPCPHCLAEDLEQADNVKSDLRREIEKLEKERDAAILLKKQAYKRMDRAVALMSGYDPVMQWNRLVGEILATIRVNMERGTLIVKGEDGRKRWDEMIAHWKECQEAYKE